MGFIKKTQSVQSSVRQSAKDRARHTFRRLLSYVGWLMLCIIIIAWLFGCFIEGASGFGTPAAIVAPLLVAIGFPAMAAVMLGMLVQSTPVSFGAVGTPIIIGITSGLDSEAVGAQLLANGSDWASFLQLITNQVAIVHAIVGTVIPLIMVLMLTRFFGKEKSLCCVVVLVLCCVVLWLEDLLSLLSPLLLLFRKQDGRTPGISDRVEPSLLHYLPSTHTGAPSEVGLT